MFRPAQAVGMIARKQLGNASAGPVQLVAARLPMHRNPMVAGNGEQAAHSFDHQAARLVHGRSDQGDAALSGHRQGMDPLRPRPGLAEPTPRPHQPHPPAVSGRRQLRLVRPGLEKGVEREQVFGRHTLEDGQLFFRGTEDKSAPPGIGQVEWVHRGPVASVSPSSARCFNLASFSRMRSRTSFSSSWFGS